MPPDDTDLNGGDAPVDVRSTILAAYDAAEAAPEAGGEAPKEISEQVEPTEGRARGPDGKFVRAEAGDASQDVAESQTSVPEDKAAVPTENVKTPEGPASVEPPAHWAAADKEAFKKVPPESQAWLMGRYKDMEGDHTRKTQQIAEFRRDFEPVAQLLAPHKAEMEAGGWTPAHLINSYIAVEKRLVSGDGIGVIRDLINNPAYKFDRAAVARELGFVAPQGAPGTEAPPRPEGQTVQLPPDVAFKLNQFDQFIATQQRVQAMTAQREQTSAAERAMGTVNQFRDAKDANGALLHPHFAEVEDHMARLAKSAVDRGEVLPPLDEIYDQAVWATPSIREKLLSANVAAQAAQRVAAEKTARDEARAKSERARRAGSSVAGSPGLGQPAATSTGNGSKSVREALLAAMEDHEAA